MMDNIPMKTENNSVNFKVASLVNHMKSLNTYDATFSLNFKTYSSNIVRKVYANTW